MVWLWPSFPSHIVGVFQQLGQTQYPHKRREILRSNPVKGNLRLIAELVDYPFLITAQLHGTVKLFLDLRESRLSHVDSTQWGNKKYMNRKHLEAALEDVSIAG